MYHQFEPSKHLEPEGRFLEEKVFVGQHMEVEYELLKPMSAFLGDDEARVDDDGDGNVDEKVPVVESISFVHGSGSW